ncbi:alpha/beta fold hydrolase [Microtetraspora sp. AC03309]|uniref:alpha/beta fold hydrolase n=1 Tax=Microtetraspora sp. AC03309 TaxID=2779376 RepID=UPI001E2E658D|nr:alpha/beta fold hydrolase [Microtetraspora sp. AC03309]MCC5576005.1 alpha/beta fold hydrolase [Microtetraspora sp. AC03309]
MSRARTAGMAGLTGAVLALSLPAPATAAEHAGPSASAVANSRSGSGLSSVQWKSCPAYSDEVIRSLGVTEDKVAAFHSLMKRLECGTVSVPQDHRDPAGRKIDIAVTRLAATDEANRLGAVAVLPGGPGGSGYLDPILRVTLRNAEMAELNERYDIIGFDPRGVGYSTKVACEPGPRGPDKPGPLTKESARKIYDAQVAANLKCANSNPDFLGQLTTDTVARDLDQVRTALGDRTLNLLGLSWGTYLGAAYRSLFPTHTGRVFLDSPAPPWTRLDRHIEESAAAVERNFGRMAAWLARGEATYGLGATAKQVRKQVVKLVRDYDKSPKTYTDLPLPIDGSAVADLARRNSTEWARAGKALSELRTATGTTAPPTVKELLGAPMGAPVPGAPEMTNATMNWAVTCNEDGSRPSFDTTWHDYRRLQKRFAATGRSWGMTALCSGWPLPVQQATLKRGSGSLVLAAHLYEYMSVYDWALQTRRAVGGTVYTIADDVHVSATRVPECAADLVKYFETGRIDSGCEGSGTPN